MPGPLPICYLNGEFLPLAGARVSALDRGFLFGDAAYEVLPVYASRPFRLREHLNRLDRSLHEIGIAPPLPHAQWAHLCGELIARNSATQAYLYLQVTRGAELGRNHAWPDGLKPTLFAYATALEPLPEASLAEGVSAVTATDIRWARRDIKTTALLANILLKKISADAGAYETILLDQGQLTEGSSTTVHIVKDGTIRTPPNGAKILPGTTREVVTELAARLGVPCQSVAVSEAELRSADEVWLAFATRGVLPVTRLDGAAIGGGKPGPLFKRMHAALLAYIDEISGEPAL